MIIFGGVPIFVFMPPRMEANANGIKNLDGFHSFFCAMPIVIGNNIAIAPILFMNEERKAAVTSIRTINCAWLVTLL